MSAPARTSHSFAQRMLLAGLMLCVLLAQSLSLAHRTLHHDLRMLAHAHEEQHATHAHEADCDHGLFSRLFASHEEGDEACRVLDGASSDVGQIPALALAHTALNALYLIAISEQIADRLPHSGFEARAPPARSL